MTEFLIKYIREKSLAEDLTCQEMIYDIHEAKKAIECYKHHLRRNYAQNYDHESLLGKSDKTTAVVTCDWGSRP